MVVIMMLTHEANNAETEWTEKGSEQTCNISSASQSSRVELLILMWSHANLTMILRDTLSQGSGAECRRISQLTVQKYKVRAGGFFSGN